MDNGTAMGIATGGAFGSPTGIAIGGANSVNTRTDNSDHPHVDSRNGFNDALVVALHHGNPLVEGLTKESSCVTVDQSPKALLPSLQIDTSSPNANEVESKITDNNSGVLESRHSLYEHHVWKPNIIDTEIRGRDGKSAGTISSSQHGIFNNYIDTVVKDSSGKVLRELESTLFGVELCTHVK